MPEKIVSVSRYIGPDFPQRSFVLADGKTILLRPIGRADTEREREFIKALSPETRRARFMYQMSEPSESMIDRLTDIDYVSEVALAALFKDKFVGISRYSVDNSMFSCECAVVVRDDWQRLGVGQLLLQELISIARDRGMREMHSVEFSENGDIRALAKRSGFVAKACADDSTMTRYTLDLQPQPISEPAPPADRPAPLS